MHLFIIHAYNIHLILARFASNKHTKTPRTCLLAELMGIFRETMRARAVLSAEAPHSAFWLFECIDVFRHFGPECGFDLKPGRNSDDVNDFPGSDRRSNFVHSLWFTSFLNLPMCRISECYSTNITFPSFTRCCMLQSAHEYVLQRIIAGSCSVYIYARWWRHHKTPARHSHIRCMLGHCVYSTPHPIAAAILLNRTE